MNCPSSYLCRKLHPMEYNITTIETSNEAILKFQANHFLVQQAHEFKSIEEAKNAPLAYELFQLPFIKTIYIASNFVAIEKYDIVSWADVKDAIAQQLVEYLNAGEPVVHEMASKQANAVTVYAEATPNPSVMKFVANKLIVPALYEFKNIDEAKHSKLATELFKKPYVKQVFMDENYLSVTKYEIGNWDEITIELRDLISEFIGSGAQAVDSHQTEAQKSVKTSSAKTAEKEASYSKTDDPISAQIIAILDEYVKPAVASDGGNIQFEHYDTETKKVHVLLQGACSGCPSSTFTLKNGIETMLKNMLGDTVSEVVATNG
jgi:NFU1 iron-sulfur cluster scaffold homolog, mitochondrial